MELSELFHVWTVAYDIELYEMFDILFLCNEQSSVNILPQDVAHLCSNVYEYTLKTFFNNDYHAYQEAWTEYEAYLNND